MENRQTKEYSDLVADVPVIGESTIIKKDDEKSLAQIFDTEFAGKSSEVNQYVNLDQHKSKHIGNQKKLNVDGNIVTTLAENRKITKSHLLQNQSQIKKELTDDTHVKSACLNQKDSGKSEDPIKETMKNYMTRMEQLLYDFDKANTELNIPKTLFTSSNKSEDKEEIIGSIIRLDAEHEHDKKDDREQDLACILSDSCLLEKAMEQLRKKFKHFDMKPDTLKTSKVNQNHLQSFSTNDVKEHERKTHVTNGTSKMSVLDIIEKSRRSRGKQSIIFQNLNDIQRLEITKRHFNIDGLCMRSNECLVNSSPKKDSINQKLRAKSVNFHRVFSKADQLMKILIPVTATSTSSISKKIATRVSQKKENKRDGVEDSNLSTCKIAKEDDQKSQQISSEFNQPTTISRSSYGINDSCGEINGEVWFPDKLKVMETHLHEFKYGDEIDRIGGSLNISFRNNSGKISSKDNSSVLEASNEGSNSSTETAFSSHFLNISTEDPLEIKESTGKDIGVTYIKAGQIVGNCHASHKRNILPSKSSQENDVLRDDGQPEKSGLPKRRVKAGSPQNLLLFEGQPQKVSDMYSLPVGNDELIIDPSQTVSAAICNNLQSTCMYFDEKRAVTELLAVLVPEEKKMKKELEKLGEYEDFEKTLLYNTRLTSETNQTI